MRIFKSEKEYRKYPAISQSSLGYLDQHPKYYYYKVYSKHKEEEDKSHFRLGSAIDTYLTDPSEFHKLFVKAAGYCPTEKMNVLCKSFFKHFHINKLSYEDAFLMAYQESGYKTSSKAIREKFESKANQAYVKELLRTKDKTLLTDEEYQMVRSVGDQLRTCKHTREYFNPDYQEEHKEYLYQFPLLFRCQGKECKGLLDLLIIDHKNKTMQIVDLKHTGKSNLFFKKSFLQFRYYLQAAFYTYGLQYFKKRSKMTVNRDLSGYAIENFMFVVAESKTYNLPLIFTCTDNDLKVGREGGYDASYGRYYKGYLQLLDELKWHENTGNWDMPKEAYDESLCLSLDVFKPLKKDNTIEN